VVGWYTDVVGVTHGFIWMSSTGQYTTLNFPNSDSTTVSGINHDGEIIGSYSDLSSQLAGCTFLYVNGGFQRVTIENSCESNNGQINNAWTSKGINDSGEIVGDTNDFNGATSSEDGPEAFTYTPITPDFDEVGFPFTLIAPQESELDGINDQGEAVGGYTSMTSMTSPPVRYAFYLNRTGVHTITDLPGSWSQANGINDAGDIVGTYDSSFGFIQDGKTTGSLYYPGSLATSPQAISDQTNVVSSAFYVVGGYETTSGNGPVEVAFLATVTPQLTPLP